MADTMRWRYGDTNPVVWPVASDSVIEVGDLVYAEGAEVRPASRMDDFGTLAGNQEAFHDVFAGVAMQRSRDGDTTPIRVATTGVFEFDCASDQFEIGELFGAVENASGDGLLDQKVVGVATPALAIGRCSRRVATANTRVLLDIVSTVSHGGPQAAA